jgi:poly-gamma-glutamate synthesis protein (capsule biosynthesis protein)
VRRRRLTLVVALALLVGGGTAAALAGGGASAIAPAAPHPVQIVVAASGDLLIHSPVWEQAQADGGGSHYDFTPMFSQIKAYVQSADLPLCHVETPVTPSPPTGYPIFNAPPALATAVHATGWKACSTAATHTLDGGQKGIDETNQVLDRNGILHTGSFSSAAAQRTPLIITVKGVKVAFLSYTELTNGIPSPHPWSVNRANAPQILSDARQARADGAQAVVVNLHWGDEDVTQPSRFQLGLADQLTRSPDITAIVGQHVHVVQPIRTINGKLVVFGTGNLISNQTPSCCAPGSQDGMIALVTIEIDGPTSRVTFVHYLPIWVRHPDFVVLPAGVAAGTDRADAAALRASYQRTVATVGRTANIQPIPDHLP